MSGNDSLEIQRYLNDIGLSDYESAAYTALLKQGQYLTKHPRLAVSAA
jgi:sugar-specific transcriptional regulator TrmB